MTKNHNVSKRKLDVQMREEIDRVERLLNETVGALATTLESRDPYTAGHQKRVAQLAVKIAREMGLPEERVKGIGIAGTLHDIGKINVPAEILSKPGKLNNAEFMLIKAHPEVGYDILKPIEFPTPVAEMVKQHHERLNGTGYPDGMSGNDILLEAKILAVADVVEAMSSHRPYRDALGLDKALEEIKKNAGILYDEDVVSACLSLYRDNS